MLEEIILLVVFLLIIFLYFVVNFIKVKGRIQLKDKHVLITGGSKGIGFSLAENVLKEGALVTLVARNESFLKEACSKLREIVKCSEKMINYICCDVSVYDSSLETMIIKLIEQNGVVDILINCAGTSLNKKFIDCSIVDFKTMIDINYIGSLTFTKLLLPYMIEKNFGQIAFVSSIAGQIGLYGYSAYSASKFALRGFAESLSMEISSYNVGLTLIYPPDTDTPGFQHENMNKLEVTKLISETGGLFRPDYVAKCTLDAIKKRKFHCSIGLDGLLISILTCGGSIPSSLCELLKQFLLVGPIRLVYTVFIMRFKRIIQLHKR